MSYSFANSSGATQLMMDEQLKEQKDLYDKSWGGGLDRGKEQRGNLQINLDFLAQTGRLQASDNILEIGCGIGTVVFELSRQGYDITGTDISSVAVEYGLAKYGDIRLEVQPAETLAFDDEAFDVVLSFDLFEHIASIDRHVAEVRRVLKPGGCYLFQTPNKLSNAVFETLSHKSLRWRRYHPSLHTPRQLRRRLTRHGFDVRFIKMDPINAYTKAKLKKLGPLGALVKRIDFTRLPLGLQTNLYVIAKKGS